MLYQDLMEKIRKEVKPLLNKGRVANYIPPLGGVSPDKFGMAICTVNGETFTCGDAEEPFSIQSISKVITLTMALNKLGADIWERTGREPSGNPFNSLIQLEYEKGKPRNPFINAGAIVVADMILDEFPEPQQSLLEFTRKISGNTHISFDDVVAVAEKRFGHTNRALANFIKSFGNLNNEVEEVLDFYFHQCSITMTCADLAQAFTFLANGGKSALDGSEIVGASTAKRINAILLTCGLYDDVGDFAYRVGLPGKSGVGGGIVAVVPGELAVAVWSPGLNEHGNSLAGVKALELFTTYAGNSIF
ncbi:MAG: glutaminase [Flavobacteriales bacterium]|nr:glutaminase [Flavobacteriales bacterium]MCB9448559.1 glutaminase [Flavobacteriales bacterium]